MFNDTHKKPHILKSERDRSPDEERIGVRRHFI